MSSSSCPVRCDVYSKVYAHGMDESLSLLKEIRESQQTSKCESCHTLEIKLRICKSARERLEKRVNELEDLLDKTATTLAGMCAQTSSIVWILSPSGAAGFRIQEKVAELGQEVFETNQMIRRALSGDRVPVLDSSVE